MNHTVESRFSEESWFSKACTLFEKSNFWPKIQFWQNLKIFLVKSKLSTAKKSKTTTFSRVFHPKKIDNYFEISKLNFWTKNEDFEQCARKHFEFEFSRQKSTVKIIFENIFSTSYETGWFDYEDMDGKIPIHDSHVFFRLFFPAAASWKFVMMMISLVKVLCHRMQYDGVTDWWENC